MLKIKTILILLFNNISLPIFLFSIETIKPIRLPKHLNHLWKNELYEIVEVLSFDKGKAPGQFWSPSPEWDLNSRENIPHIDIQINQDGEIFLLDDFNDRIQKFSLGSKKLLGVFPIETGSVGKRFVIDKFNNLYVTFSVRSYTKLMKISPTGQLLWQISRKENESYFKLRVDSEGNLFVLSDVRYISQKIGWQRGIKIFNPEGKFLTQISSGEEFIDIYDFEIDSNDNIYTLPSFRHQLWDVVYYFPYIPDDAIGIVGIDNQNNVYFLCRIFDSRGDWSWISKVNPRGKIIEILPLRFLIKRKEFTADVSWFKYDAPSIGIHLKPNGTLYLACQADTESGWLKIIKIAPKNQK